MANITDFIGDLQLPIDCDFNGDVDEEKVFMRLVAEYWNNHEDEKNADLKSLPWRDDNNSPTPTASDSGVSSNCSIISDDMAISPQTQFVRVAFTTAVFATNNNSHNGHKKLNRSQSEPRARYNKHNSGGSASLRYKTELCHPFEENGVCKYGEKCQFAHGVHELRHLARHPKYKSELCRTFHAEGYCPYGTRCHFIHGDSSTKTKPAALSLYPTIPSASSVKDLSQSPSSLSSLSPASSMTVFSFAAPLLQMSPVCSPPPSPTEARLPIFNEISAPALRSYGQFGGLTA